MAFPSVTNTASTTNGLGTSVALTMPASIVAGRLLLALVESDGLCTGVTGGWTSKGAVANGATNLAVFGKVAAGSDTGSATFGASQTCNAVTYQVDAWSGSVAGIGFASAANLSPPNLNMGSAADYLWIVGAGCAFVAVSVAPANYTNLISVAGNKNFTNMGTARRALNASSEDPGTFGGGSSPVSVTVAIPPAGGGPPPATGSFLTFFA